MKRKALSNIAASSLIIATTMVGCSGAALNSRSGISAGKMERMADAQASAAEKAIAKGNAGQAIQIAEAAVAASPQDSGYRTLLGRAYLLGGRFDSARTAFQDSLTLGSRNVRTIVNLALIHTAQGRSEQARMILADHADALPAADYGLAMAMAGDPDEAVRVLSQAIHDPAATAKERQNLAYSYALAGRWVEAKQMASVDLPPDQAALRVLGWAQLAQPGGESRRVIAMMGVNPRADDTGLPARLALIQPAPQQAPVQMAEAEPAPAPVPAATWPIKTITEAVEEIPADIPAPVEFAAADPAPAMVPATASAPEPAPQPEALKQQPKEQDVSPYFTAKPAMLANTDIPAPKRAAKWQPVNPDNGSAWVVQLGAFSTQDAAPGELVLYTRRNAVLSQFPPVHSTAVVKGREFHRVAVAGFGGRGDANEFCGSIRARGGKCFVRLGGPEAAPSIWAQALKKPQRIAMR